MDIKLEEMADDFEGELPVERGELQYLGWSDEFACVTAIGCGEVAVNQCLSALKEFDDFFAVHLSAHRFKVIQGSLHFADSM